MAGEGTQRPGIAGDRYELLTGGRGGRLTYWAIIKRLRITAPEWDKLPWYVQRMYLEMLREEIESENEEGGGGSVDAASDDITAYGFQVQRD